MTHKREPIPANMHQQLAKARAYHHLRHLTKQHHTQRNKMGKKIWRASLSDVFIIFFKPCHQRQKHTPLEIKNKRTHPSINATTKHTSTIIMCITARKLMISLLILAQGIVLWQGAFASGHAVDTENLPCHQVSISEHTQHATPATDDEQCGCDKGCAGFCHCNHCTCSGIALISSYFAFSFSHHVLNCTALPIFLDGPSAQLLKPPRKFHS